LGIPSQSSLFPTAHSESGVSPEKEQSMSLFVNDFFVVDEIAAHCHHPLQRGHVVFLAFDRVGEEDVSVFGLEERAWHFFHSKNDRTRGKVFLSNGSGLTVFIV
jgi:hypothetical protein